MAVSRPLLAQRAGVGAEVRGSPSGASHRGAEVGKAEEALADTSEDAAEVSGEASAVVAKGSKADRATEEATLAGKVSGDPAAPAVPGAAAGVMAGGRGAGGPCAKVSNQVHVDDVFFIFLHFFKFFSPLFRFHCKVVLPSQLCLAHILYNIMSFHTSVFWPSSKEGAQVNSY